MVAEGDARLLGPKREEVRERIDTRGGYIRIVREMGAPSNVVDGARPSCQPS